MTIRNSIVAGNGYFQDASPDVSSVVGQTVTVESSLIGNNSGLGFPPAPVGVPDAKGNLIGTPAARIDPKLGPLQENGGPTQTHALLADGPAIDAGDPSFAPPPDTDQRGLPFVRVADGPDADSDARLDMGAYEFQTVGGLSLVVDTAADEIDGNYAPGDLSLREAVTLANGSIGLDTINFDMSIAFAMPKTIGLAFGELAITDSLTIHGPGSANLTIDAMGTSRVFNIDDSNNSTHIAVEVAAMTLTGGKAMGEFFPADSGGAIFSRESLTVRDSVVSGNTASSRGGGIHTRTYTGATTKVQDVTISGNSATAGGGIDCQTLGGTTTIQKSTISGNFATLRGGGIYSDSKAGTTTIQDSTISGNSSFHGGGLQFNNGSYGRTTIQNSTISGNTANGSGGGVFTYNFGVTTIQNSTISGNSAAQDGGGRSHCVRHDDDPEQHDREEQGGCGQCRRGYWRRHSLRLRHGGPGEHDRGQEQR